MRGFRKNEGFLNRQQMIIEGDILPAAVEIPGHLTEVSMKAKHFLALFLAAVTALTVLPVAVFAFEPPEDQSQPYVSVTKGERQTELSERRSSPYRFSRQRFRSG